MNGYRYVIEIEHPLRGPTLVGPWYVDKAACKSWVRFVKLAYHGIPTRTRQFTLEQARRIQANGGQQYRTSASEPGRQQLAVEVCKLIEGD